MRFRIILLTALVLFTGACSFPSKLGGTKKGGEYDVFLLIGQSNMAGRGVLEESDTLPMDGVWLLKEDGSITPASEPLNRYSTIRKKVGMQQFNLGDSFARAIHKKTGRKVLLVVNARGGSSMEHWLKGAAQRSFNKKEGDDPERIGQPIPVFYDETLRRTREALRYGTLKAILWHQGESNSSEAKRVRYLGQLASFVGDLRRDLGLGDIPFIAGELNYARRSSPEFNAMLQNIGKVIPKAWCASAEGCGSNPDNTHFNRQGLVLLGERYAEIVLKQAY